MRMRRCGLLVTIGVCLLFAAGCAAPAPLTPLAPTATAVPPSPTPPPPTAAAAPASAELPGALEAYVEAFNRADVDAVLATLADDGLVYIDPGLVWLDTGYVETGEKEAVRNHLEWMFGKGTTMAIKECTADGEKWRCTAGLRDDCLGIIAGLDEWPYDMTVKVQGDKIQVMLFATHSSSSTEGQADALANYEDGLKLTAWAQANRPGAMEKVMSKEYGRANGEVTSEVCKAYIATLK